MPESTAPRCRCYFPPWPASLAGSWLPECLRRGESQRRGGSLPSALPEAAGCESSVDGPKPKPEARRDHMPVPKPELLPAPVSGPARAASRLSGSRPACRARGRWRQSAATWPRPAGFRWRRHETAVPAWRARCPAWRRRPAARRAHTAARPPCAVRPHPGPAHAAAAHSCARRSSGSGVYSWRQFRPWSVRPARQPHHPQSVFSPPVTFAQPRSGRPRP